jgi:dTDP-4-dehydrorhamnose 3,5-epimerase-like enzyme/dTDP-4-dehydrorhamnose reductase
MIHSDNRGELHSIKSLPFTPKEILVSINDKNVFKGLHHSPYEKYIYIAEGHIFDIYADVKNKSYKTIELKKGDYLYIPADYAHGFYCYEKTTIIYLLGDNHNSSNDKKIHYMTPEFNITYDFNITNAIMSESDIAADYMHTYKYLVIGGTGYLGSNLIKHLENYLCINTRLNDLHAIKQHIIKSKCQYVLCASGISGRPTTDWCEKNERETYETNYLDMLNFVQLCDNLGVHLTIFGSGLVYSGKHKEIYTECDEPNYTETVYSYYRAALENILRRNIYANVLYLRIMYPCTFDDHAKCFFNKMKQRAILGNVHNVKVPVTIVPDLFPKIPILLHQNITGILNFVSYESISLIDVLKLGGVSYVHEPIYIENSNEFKLSSSKLSKILECE